MGRAPGTRPAFVHQLGADAVAACRTGEGAAEAGRTRSPQGPSATRQQHLGQLFSPRSLPESRPLRTAGTVWKPLVQNSSRARASGPPAGQPLLALVQQRRPRLCRPGEADKPGKRPRRRAQCKAGPMVLWFRQPSRAGRAPCSGRVTTQEARSRRPWVIRVCLGPCSWFRNGQRGGETGGRGSRGHALGHHRTVPSATWGPVTWQTGPLPAAVGHGQRRRAPDSRAAER